QNAAIFVANERMPEPFPRARLRFEQMTRGIRAIRVDARIVVMRPKENMATRMSEQLDKLDGVLHVIENAASDAHIERMPSLAQVGDKIAEQKADIFEP